jgi:acetylornithine aminotransferase
MIGIELDRPCSAIMGLALEAGLLLSVTADRVIRLVPPLIITQKDCDEIVSILTPVVQSFLAQK